VKLVEVEAYLGPDDPASHAAGWRRTGRNEVMYGAPGLAYVYFTYGMHWCLNVVTDREDYPGAVLLRAGEPLEGLETMRRRRGTLDDRLLCSGPARLTQALGVRRSLNGHRLEGPPLWIAPGLSLPRGAVQTGPRVGIRVAADWPLRFLVRGNPWVSAGRGVNREPAGRS
jgi:DNA-3-methyladenine glycosylase